MNAPASTASAASFPFLPHIAVSARSDVGPVRKVNEDSFAVAATARLLVVADGVGGHGRGDRASSLAVSTMVSYLTTLSSSEKDQADSAAAAVRAANSCIFAENREYRTSNGLGMGTTVTGLWFPHNLTTMAIIFSVGDSRVYRLREDTLQLMTRDHSLYQEWLDLKKSDDAPPRNIITRSVGTQAKVSIDLFEIDLRPKDMFIVCSDGMTTVLDDSEIRDIASGCTNVQEKCSALINTSLERGARDNVTVIVAAITT